MRKIKQLIAIVQSGLARACFEGVAIWLVGVPMPNAAMDDQSAFSACPLLRPA
ncbi:hypothetical protein [Kitasatospora sp. NPDC057500]|uniref:hypothetical protein n=1 Tax=Kitasatospora sp. NPDC057500 TaxID=3346151 RepID=UPI003699CBDD